MPKRVELVRGFKHADDGIHAVPYEPATYEVGAADPAHGGMSAGAAEVALAEGWAREVESPKGDAAPAEAAAKAAAKAAAEPNSKPAAKKRASRKKAAPKG